MRFQTITAPVFLTRRTIARPRPLQLAELGFEIERLQLLKKDHLQLP